MILWRSYDILIAHSSAFDDSLDIFVGFRQDGFEAWTEWRRTGYPDFLVPSAANGGRTYQLRFLYPQSELIGNLNYPGTVPETTPVWWDKQ